jgi:hypothetical protein
MRNVSAGKVTSGQTAVPSLKKSNGAPASSTTPKMPNVGGHTTNTGNGKQGC